MPADDDFGVPADARPSSARWRTRLLAGLVAIAVVLAGLVAWVTVVVHGQQHRTDFRQSALAAARQFAVDFSTYDYQHADQDLARLKSEATGDLRNQVAAAQKQLLTLLRQGKATARGAVRRSAIYRVAPSGVTVLAVVDQTFSNVAVSQGGGTHRYRFVLDLTHTHGRWLVRNFQFV